MSRASRVLSVEGFAPVAEQIIVGRKGFVSGIGRIDFGHIELFLVSGRTMQDGPTWSDDFAISDKCQLILSASCFAAYAVARDREDSIFQTPNRHGVRTIGQDEVRRMADDLCPLERQCASRLRIVPIETNHHPDLGQSDIPDLKSRIARGKKERFFKEEMCLAITADKP